jgi:hypothetical protein
VVLLNPVQLRGSIGKGGIVLKLSRFGNGTRLPYYRLRQAPDGVQGTSALQVDLLMIG